MDWEIAKALLQTALDRSKGGQTIDDVKQALLDNKAQLWTADNTAVVTENYTGKHGLDCNVWLYAGNLKAMADLDKSAAAYAAHLGMNRMTVSDARKGWARVLEKLGYKSQENGDLIKELE